MKKQTKLIFKIHIPIYLVLLVLAFIIPNQVMDYPFIQQWLLFWNQYFPGIEKSFNNRYGDVTLPLFFSLVCISYATLLLIYPIIGYKRLFYFYEEFKDEYKVIQRWRMFGMMLVLIFLLWFLYYFIHGDKFEGESEGRKDFMITSLYGLAIIGQVILSVFIYAIHFFFLTLIFGYKLRKEFKSTINKEKHDE